MSVNPKIESTDTLKHKISISKDAPKHHIASISTKEDNPFNFVRVLLEGAVAGAAAGVVVESALYPLDTIKTRLQAVRGGGQIILKGLYSGLAGNLAGVLPASAIFIGVYEPTKQKLLKSCPENLSALAHLTAGAVGGAASSIIRVPTEVIKQRMQTGHFASAPDAVRLIVAKEGFKGLFAIRDWTSLVGYFDVEDKEGHLRLFHRQEIQSESLSHLFSPFWGYSSFLLRDLPFDAIQFCIYEQLRIGYKLAAKRNLSDPENAVIGAFAGAITGAVTTPLDVIKTRLMVQGSGNQYKSISHCVGTILKEEGPSAFLKGIGPRVLWIGIGGSIFFGVLERTKQLLAERRTIDSDKLD